MYAADLAAIRDAAARIAPYAHHTPVFTSTQLDALAGRSLFFKGEHLQRVGAFKFRGACNAIWSLEPPAVVTHSSGNHAQAVALAAKIRGIPAHIVMPSDAPVVKRQAVEGYGAKVYPCEPILAARESTAEAVRLKTGSTLIPPYDHPLVIAGAGTTGLELFEQVAGLDAVIVPVGGGGLLSGVTLALRGLSPKTRIFAAEPFGADDAWRSKQAGEFIPQLGPKTIADGLKTSLGEHTTWPVVRDLVEAVIRVTEEEVVAAVRLIWTRMKQLVGPSAAVPLAAVLSAEFADIEAARVGLVLSGGNTDLDRLPW